MSKSLEDRIAELEALVQALMNLVMSDIASTTEEGLRDLDGALGMADGQAAAAIQNGQTRIALNLRDMIDDIRSVLAAARESER